MRILRLSHSGDIYRAVPEEARSAYLTARALEATTGEPVETTSRPMWPAPELPDLVERWLERYHPDVVIFWVSPHWFTHVQLPKPRSGRPFPNAAGRAATQVGVRKAVRRRARRLRRQILVWRGVGHERFEPAEVIALCETIIRRVRNHDEILLIVRGAEWPSVPIPCRSRLSRLLNRSMLARAEGRRLVVHRALKAVCEQADVRYFGAEDGLAYFRQGDLCADGIHPNAGPHARMASEETAAILAAASPGQLRPVTTPRPSE